MDFSHEYQQVEALIAQGQFAEAKKVILGVLAINQQNAAAWYMVSRCLVNDPPLARAEALRRVLLCDPDHPLAKAEFEALGGLELLQPPSLMRRKAALPKVPPLPLLLVLGAAFVILSVLFLGNPQVAASMERQANTPIPGPATVVAQQTTTAALAGLSGTLIIPNNETFGVSSPKVRFIRTGALPSPDGHWLAYLGPDQFGVLAPIDESTPQKVGMGWSPLAWSPDSQQVIFGSGQGLWLVDVKNPAEPRQLSKQVGDAQWSPKGHHLALLGGSGNATSPDLSVIQLDQATPVSKVLYKQVNLMQNVMWFPDGQHLLLSVNKNSATKRMIQLLSIPVDGTAPKVLAEINLNEIIQSYGTSIAPDGSRISLLAMYSNGEEWLDFVSVANGTIQKMVQVAGALQPYVDFAWSPNGQFAAGIIQLPNQLPHAYWVDMKTMQVFVVKTDISKGYRFGVWAPDSQAFLICHQAGGSSSGLPVTGETLLVPTTPDAPLKLLFNQPLCPLAWLP